MKEQEHLNILVVDDEEEICKMFKKWLLLKGHQVKFASTGKSAIGLIKKENFDIVYLDIVMPGISGIEVFEKIRKIPSKTKIVLMTGELLDNKVLEELKQKGISKILKKPFKNEDINAANNSF
ncbi:MAG: response regulator [Candidatus Aminicenantes bacterium]|nr:response regulator [Candidatus Aminicenantes bacterium]